MKWFKHISDSLDDPFVSRLIELFGSDGYLVFFGVLEIMSREFDVNSPGTSTLSYKFLRKKLQLSRQKILKILRFCDKKERIFIEEHADEITLNCPKLKELTDEYTQKRTKRLSGLNPESVGIKSDSSRAGATEEEVEGEGEGSTDNNSLVPNPEHLRLCQLFYNRASQNRPYPENVDPLKKNFQGRYGWLNDMRLLIEHDKRTPAEIEAVIYWVCQDEFWRDAARSPGALRGKTRAGDQLKWEVIKARMEKGHASRREKGPEPARDSEPAGGRYPVDIEESG